MLKIPTPLHHCHLCHHTPLVKAHMDPALTLKKVVIVTPRHIDSTVRCHHRSLETAISICLAEVILIENRDPDIITRRFHRWKAFPFIGQRIEAFKL